MHPMYIYFQDGTGSRDDSRLTASPVLDYLKERGHLADTHIKAFASPINPQDLFPDSYIAVFMSSGKPFGDDEVFLYKGREPYPATQIEILFERYRLNPRAREIARALLRFIHYPHLEFAQRALTVRDPQSGRYLVDTPFSLLHGLRKLNERILYGDTTIHYDILSRESIRQFESLLGCSATSVCVSAEQAQQVRKAIYNKWIEREVVLRRKEG